MSDDVTGDLGAPQPRRGLGARTGATHGAMLAWYLPNRHPDKTAASPIWEDVAPKAVPSEHALGLMRTCAYDLLVGWYLWVVAIVLVLVLIALGAILVQRRRRSGGVLSVRPRPKKERQ